MYNKSNILDKYLLNWDGVWYLMGKYQQLYDGDTKMMPDGELVCNPTIEGEKESEKVLRLLWLDIGKYKEQIKEDWQKIENDYEFRHQYEAEYIAIKRLSIICKDYEDRCKYLDELVSKMQQSKCPKFSIPNELNTDKASRLLGKAMQYGLCDASYKWLKTKALLAYFSAQASDYLSLTNSKYGEKQKISWQPFEQLFQVTGLAGANNENVNKYGPPKDSKIVDDIFKELNNSVNNQ